MHVVCPEHFLALGQQAQGWPGLHNKRSLLKTKIKIYQDTYCKGHIHTALPGTCTSQGKGLETHRGQQQLHTGSDYCICKARRKKKEGSERNLGRRTAYCKMRRGTVPQPSPPDTLYSTRRQFFKKNPRGVFGEKKKANKKQTNKNKKIQLCDALVLEINSITVILKYQHHHQTKCQRLN